MHKILRLNSAGHPIDWINYQTAARLYYLKHIICECGSSSIRLRGGYNRLKRHRSFLNLNSIVSTNNINKLDYSLSASKIDGFFGGFPAVWDILP